VRQSIVTELISASRYQDHTTSPFASGAFVKALSTSIASRTAFVTIAKRPSYQGGTGQARKGDLPVGASAHFLLKAGRPHQLGQILEFAFLAQKLATAFRSTVPDPAAIRPQADIQQRRRRKNRPL
jgi:hypothetical protein